MTIFVGNLPYSVTEREIRETFEQIAALVTVKLITDHETGKSKGFAFVEMQDDDALRAIREFDGVEWGGRRLSVNMAKPKERRPASQQTRELSPERS